MGLGLLLGVTTQTLGTPGTWVILNHPSVPYAYKDTRQSGIPSCCVSSATVPSDLVKGNGSHWGVHGVTCVMSAQTAFIHCPPQDPCLHLSLEILIPSGKVTQTQSPVYSPGCLLGPQEPETTILCRMAVGHSPVRTWWVSVSSTLCPLKREVLDSTCRPRRSPQNSF